VTRPTAPGGAGPGSAGAPGIERPADRTAMRPAVAAAVSTRRGVELALLGFAAVITTGALVLVEANQEQELTWTLLYLGAAYMAIAGELEVHAAQELEHALIIAKQIDYLGGSPTVTPKPVKTSDDAKTMLRFDLENENETIRNYRERVRQCEALGEFALAEHIREILKAEQEHQIDLATALGEDVPDMSRREGQPG